MGAGFSYLFAVVIARSLDVNDVGIFFLALTIVTIASSLSRFGLENASLKFVAINASELNWPSIKSLYFKVIKIVTGISIFLTLILWNTTHYLATLIFSNPLLDAPLKWLSLMIIPHALLWIHAEFLKGLSKITYAQIAQGASLPLLSLLGVFLFRNSLQLGQVVIIYVLSAFVTCIISFLLWFQAAPEIGNSHTGFFSTKKLLDCSFPLFIGSIMNLTMLWGSTLILGIFGNSSEIGIFSVAQRTSTLISFILIAVNSIAAPKFATMYNKNDIRGLSKIAQLSTQIMTIAASPFILICLFRPDWVLLIFGQEFTDGTTILSILTIGQLMNVMTGSVGFLLMMSGNEKYQRNNLICSAILNILLCFTFIPLMGAVGAAFATTITMSFTNLFAAFLVFKKLHIITFPIKF